MTYIEELQAQGRSTFTTEEAVRALGGRVPAVRAALRRLKAKGAIADPHRGFHVIVPPEFRRLGCLPAEHFVPDLMRHLAEPYYVALLSAAAHHGAAHQRPQVLQLMIARSRRRIECGAVQVELIVRHDMTLTPVVEQNTPRGILRIATPEATALELTGYPGHSGGLDNVATVLVDLAEVIDADALVTEAQRAPLAWVQRLGYLLELVRAHELASCLDSVIAERGPFLVALLPSASMTGAPTDSRWRVAINSSVEPDL